MKTIPTITLALFAVVASVAAAPLDTGFFYQGLLTEAGKPNPGKLNYEHYYDFYDSPTGGIRVAGPVTNIVEVTDGVFSTVIDFGGAVLDGKQYWLEIGLRTNSTAAFTMLSPRQPVRPTPYALHALTAGGVASNAVGNAALATNAVSADKIAPGQVVKSFNGLADDIQLVVEGELFLRTNQNQLVLAAAVSCLTYSNCYWNLLGNGNITANVNFLGTIAGELAPLDFRVNNNRSLRHEFTGAASAPNITGGFVGNTVTSVGGTIAGGGRAGANNSVQGGYGFIGGGSGNLIDIVSDDGVISGGVNNTIRGFTLAGVIGGGSGNTLATSIYTPTLGGGAGNYVGGLVSSTIAGGDFNTNQATHGAIGGGRRNFLSGTSTDGSIGGGELNSVLAVAATIAGGRTNHIDSDSDFGSIGGGATNLIRFDSPFGTIGGGGNNRIETNSPYGTISGGQRNTIDPRTSLVTIGGGGTNAVQALSAASTIGGGVTNRILGNSANATIAGGAGNLIDAAVAGGVIGGGRQNLIGFNSRASTLAGGERNRVDINAPGGTIGGGSSNLVQEFSVHATVSGGYSNTIGTTASYAAIAGGARHLIEQQSIGAAIGGGQRNTVGPRSTNSVVAGGFLNSIGSDAPSSAVGGGRGNVINQGSTNSVVAGGTFNVIGFNAPASTIGGGESNVIGNLANAVSATNATISGGRGNLIEPSAQHAVIPGGQLARATNYNQHAFASGAFARTGDAQHSQYVLRGTSTGVVQTELFLDGVDREIILWTGSMLTYDILVVGSDGASAGGYQIRGVIKNIGGVTTLVGGPDVTTLGENVAAWSVTTQADNIDDALIILVTGSGAVPVRWVAHVRTVEVRL